LAGKHRQSARPWSGAAASAFSPKRPIGGLFGSSLSFAVGEAASAPGQIPIADLSAVYDIIRRARGGK
jgi:3-dehydroquinate dehydratase-1